VSDRQISEARLELLFELLAEDGVLESILIPESSGSVDIAGEPSSR
jgi:hypothetical protein